MTGAGDPFFSVIMATYGRGRHILPSVRSILQQRFADLEVIVAGDACSDDTAQAVASLADPRLRWLNLERRVGSQSGPNNAGIAAARGRVIAYLGHDDIWEPDHLQRLAACYQADPSPDFVMSGAVLHPPHDLPGCEVMGLFPDGTDTRRHFFPPSAFSHLATVVDQIGPWRGPDEIRSQVDYDFLTRAADAGLRFTATGVITVHKFSAAQRYLSYVRQSSDEQEAMLARIAAPGHADWVAAKLAEAKASGRFMLPARTDFDRLAPGQLARLGAERKGARVEPSRPLGVGAVVRHRDEPGALDWRAAPVMGFRVNAQSPCPRLLVPLTGTRARLRFLAAHPQPGALGPLQLTCNGQAVTARPGWLRLYLARYTVDIDLLPDAPTLLEFQLAAAQRAGPEGRIAIGPLHLTPI